MLNWIVCLQDDWEGAAEGRKNCRRPTNVSEAGGQIDETSQRRSERILKSVDASYAFPFGQLTHEEESVQAHTVGLKKNI